MEATLLPPPHLDDDRGSARTLDDVGPVNVLGAMIEQRRASQPDAHELDILETPRSHRVPADSDAFLKAR